MRGRGCLEGKKLVGSEGYARRRQGKVGGEGRARLKREVVGSRVLLKKGKEGWEGAGGRGYVL